MELMRKTADTQHASSRLVQMEPAITLVRGVTGRLIAEMSLMNLTALMDAPTLSFTVAVGSALLKPTSATIALTVKMAVMNILAVLIKPASATSSRAPMVSALIKIGFVMERLTV